MRIDVIIPVYHPGERFLESLRRLCRQTRPVNRFIIMNTERELWEAWEKELPAGTLPENLSVFHVTREEFDHGGTRHRAMELSQAELCVCMTHDALPADSRLLERLTDALLSREDSAAAYARQLPAKDCGVIERYTRGFNYPEQSQVKTKEDLPRLGIKTYFCSNVCAAYRKKDYEEVGGFIKKTIFNEDMIMASLLIENGKAIYYNAKAKVWHWHDYSAMEQLHRNFDLAVSQQTYGGLFLKVKSESEGIRLVIATIKHLLQIGKWYLIPKLVWQSGFKFIGYKMGRSYEKLPKWLIKKLTMNREYWEEK